VVEFEGMTWFNKDSGWRTGLGMTVRDKPTAAELPTGSAASEAVCNGLTVKRVVNSTDPAVSVRTSDQSRLP